LKTNFEFKSTPGPTGFDSGSYGIVSM